MKHLSTYRKRNQRDSLSSGERNGNSLNQLPHGAYASAQRAWVGVAGLAIWNVLTVS